MINKNEITIVLISHNSEELVIQFIKNFSEKIKFLIIDNSNDQNLKDKIKLLKMYNKYNLAFIRIIE